MHCLGVETISKLNQMWRAGSQGLRTGHNRQLLAESGVAEPLMQAGRFSQASQLVIFEADSAEDIERTNNVVSVVLTTFLPLSGQQNIGR